MDPSPESPLHRRTLALACLKSGESLMQRCLEQGEAKQAEAIELNRQAVALLRPDAEAGIDESRHLLAVGLCQLSRARLMLERQGSADGLKDARDCLVWLADTELSSPGTLQLGLTARISAACHLEASSQDEDRFLELTDIAEEALAVAASGRRRFGTDAVDPALLGDLIRLGGDAYVIASPDFLADFILDWLDPERSEASLSGVAAAREAALEVLAQGIARIRRAGFTEMGSEEYARKEKRLVAWQDCRERLAAIRNRDSSL
jgi:hypothetical protein